MKTDEAVRRLFRTTFIADLILTSHPIFSAGVADGVTIQILAPSRLSLSPNHTIAWAVVPPSKRNRAA